MKYLTAKQLRELLLGGSFWVIKHKEKLNEINVFPVADSDTGTNLAATLYAMYQKLRNREVNSAAELLKEAARELFSNARGNSGVIFSQYISALSEQIRKEIVELKEFAMSLKKAYLKVYNSLERPMEGTILTVMKEVGEAAIKTEAKNIEAFLENLLQRARIAVEKTRELLPILKRKKVVDSGALAFLLFLEGMWLRLKRKINPQELSFSIRPHNIKTHGDQLFCTTAILESKLSKQELTKLLEGKGDSLLFSRFENLLKIHIHTSEPEVLRKELEKLGELKEFKFEPIEEEIKRIRKVGILVDSALDLPPQTVEEEGIQVVPVAVIIKGAVFKDEEEIYRQKVVEELIKGEEVSSSQPSLHDFIRAYSRLESAFEEVLAFHLSKFASGTFNTSKTAAQNSLSKVYVIDTGSFSLGGGLLVLRALEMLDSGMKASEVARQIEKLKEQVYLSIYADDLKYAVKGGRVKKWKGVLSKAFNLKLILGFSEKKEGIFLKTFAFSREGAYKKMKKDMLSKLDRDTVYDFGIAFTQWNEILEEMEAFIKENFNVRKLIKNFTSPAIMVHGGPFAFGVAALPLSPEK